MVLLLTLLLLVVGVVRCALVVVACWLLVDVVNGVDEVVSGCVLYDIMFGCLFVVECWCGCRLLLSCVGVVCGCLLLVCGRWGCCLFVAVVCVSCCSCLLLCVCCCVLLLFVVGVCGLVSRCRL